MSAPFRVGVVGCGRLAEAGYVPALARVDGAEIVAVADPDPARRDRVAALAIRSVTTHVDARSLLDEARPDAVVLATPVQHHLDDARAASDAGVPALLEKPPAPDAATAAELTTLGLPPWIAFNRRFDQGLELERKMPAGGGLELRMLLHYRRKSWRPLQTADDALLDLAPHLVDLALFLTGSLPLAVRASASRERAGIVLATTRAEVQIECATDRAHHELVDIRGADGARVASAERGGRVRGALARLAPGAHPLVRSLTLQLEAYGRALRGEHAGALATAAEGAAVMRVLDAARRSDALGGDTVAVEGVTVC